MLLTQWVDIGIATAETLYMVGMSTLLVVIFGLPLGTWLFHVRVLQPHVLLHRILSMLINAVRSVPFIILLLALLPVTRLLVGTSIGMHAAMVPLILCAIPFFARLVDNVYATLDSGLIETGHALGMNPLQMICRILLPEAKGALIQAITVTAITLVNYSAMAGTVGGGGLGDLAIRYGYQRFDWMIMGVTVLILIGLVQGMQWVGDKLAAGCAYE